jgi:hypothetical protein
MADATRRDSHGHLSGGGWLDLDLLHCQLFSEPVADCGAQWTSQVAQCFARQGKQ